MAESEHIDVSTEQLLLFMGPKGRERAFAELVKRFMPLVYHTCRRQLGDDHQAEDAAQAVFLLLHQKAPEFPNEAALASWLYRTAVLVGKRHRRDRLRRRKHEEKASREEVELLRRKDLPGDGGWGQLEDLLDEAIATLPDGMRRTLVLRYLQGLSEAETAAALSCPVGTVSSRVNKSLKKLRTYFAKRGFGSAGLGFIAAGMGSLADQAAAAELVTSTQAITVGGAAPTAAVSQLCSELGRELGLLSLKALAPWSAVLASLVGAAVVLSSGSAAVDPGPDRFVGFRGDGQGHFAATPQVERWDEASGSGLRWRTPLPNWGNGSPLVLADQVIVVCEPGQVADDRTLLFPTVLSFDREDGHERWRHVLDHLGDDDHGRALWQDLLERNARANELFHRLIHEGDATAWDEADAAGIQLPRSGGVHARCRVRFAEDRLEEALSGRYGLAIASWHRWGLYIGQAFASPASDGETIVCITSAGLVRALDRDGRLRWSHWDPELAETSRQSELHVASPLIVRDRVIVHAGKRLRCFALGDGRLLWDRDTAVHPYMVGTPVRLRVGGQDLVATASGEIVRIRDGAVLATGIGNQSTGAGPVSDGGDRLFLTNGSVSIGNRGRARFADRGTVCLRLGFSAEGELRIDQLWHNDDECAYSGERSPLYHGGRLYLGHDGTALNADSGAVLSIPDLQRAISRHAITLAGDRLLTLDADGSSAVLDLEGRVLSYNKLDIAADQGAKRRQRILQVGGVVGDGRESSGEWPFTYSLPALDAGGRIYIRSNDALYCLGTP